MQDHGPRILWRLAKVVDLIASQDGLIRGAKVRLGVKREGRGESVTVERPLQKLYPLEVSSEGEEVVRDPELRGDLLDLVLWMGKPHRADRTGGPI